MMNGLRIREPAVEVFVLGAMPKTKPDDLAILGGAPAFADPLHVGRPNIGDRDKLMERIQDLLDRNWLTNKGPYVQAFERRLEELLGVRHCVAICNGTVALEIAIRACGLSGEVIVPSFTFVATAHALRWLGITPVFCDVDPETHNIDPRQVEALITPRTTGIMGVHLWGRPCDVDALRDVAERHNLRLLYDAAHALGCTHQGRPIGNFGDLEVFSFHATKFINSFEGGAVTTNDDALADRLRLLKNFGFRGYDNVIDLGTNGKMSEVSAAMGLTSLESMSDFVEVNRRNYNRYVEQLASTPGAVPGMKPVRCDPDETSRYQHNYQHNYQYVVFEVDAAAAGLSRDQLVDVLHAENVLARRYFKPGCHLAEPYRSEHAYADLHLPVTERLADEVLALPTGTAVDVADIDAICEIIRLAVAHSQTVKAALW